MRGVHEEYGLVGGQKMQELVVARDERPLLYFVALARDRVRLVVFETQEMRSAISPERLS